MCTLGELWLRAATVSIPEVAMEMPGLAVRHIDHGYTHSRAPYIPPGVTGCMWLGWEEAEAQDTAVREVVGAPWHVSGAGWAQRDRSVGETGRDRAEPETYVCKRSRGGILCASCHSHMFMLDALCWPC